MKDYLSHSYNPDDPDLVSIIDELPLWSAPFGLELLDTVKLKPGMKALDIGCGTGFPLIELAQRLGPSGIAYGADPWEAALSRAELKIKTYGLKNVKTVKCFAEELPFDDNYFDLIVSNNGINNVSDIPTTLAECSRVSKSGAQFVMTMNLEESMIEFYDVFVDVLKRERMTDEIKKVKEHIYMKRRPLSEMKEMLNSAGFKIEEIKEDGFAINFSNAEAMFNHSLIKYWFLPSWKNILPEEKRGAIFGQIEESLRTDSETNGGIILTIPFVTIDCRKS